MNTVLFMMTVWLHNGETPAKALVLVNEYADFAAANGYCEAGVSAEDCCWRMAAKLQRTEPPQDYDTHTVYSFRYCGPPVPRLPAKTEVR